MTIADFQRRLQALGADHGPADGVAGPRTASAFEKDLKSRYGQAFAVAASGGLLVARGPLASPAPAPVATGPILYQGSARYPVTEAVVHCSATPPGWLSGESIAAKVAEIRRWHMKERGWRDIGYHHVIDRDGTVAAGRPETEIGAGVEGHNQGVIHACLIGGADSAATDPFGRNFTPAQAAAAGSLPRRARFGHSRKRGVAPVSAMAMSLHCEGALDRVIASSSG